MRQTTSRVELGGRLAAPRGRRRPTATMRDVARPRAGGSRRPARRARRCSRSAALRRHRREPLLDRPRGQAEVGRAAAGRARAAPSACRNDHSKSWAKAGSQATQPGCSMPDRRRDDRLVRAALRRQRDARRRADEDRLPAGVDAERPRLERAADERVVDRARPGSSGSPVAAPRRAQLAEQPDEVDLGDAELDVAPVARSRASARACRSRRRTSRCARRRARCRCG